MRSLAAFDTNILFSGVGWKGKPYECLELARAGKVKGVTCLAGADDGKAYISCGNSRGPIV